MTATMLLACTSAAAAAAGVWLAVVALVPHRGGERPARTTRHASRGRVTRWRRIRWTVAAATALLVWVASGWPVLAVVAGLAVVGVPLLLASGAEAARAIDRVEAVEDWTRRLADILAIGVGLEQAITSSVRTVPDLIRDPVAALAARLTARWPTEAALRAFADDLDDATGDLVVAALVLGARRRGPGLAKALGAVADAAAEEVATRRRIEADRARPRATARAVTLITVAVVGVGMLNRDYLTPYTTPAGQLVFAAIAAGFAAALWWMHDLTQPRPTARLLTRHPDGETASAGPRSGTAVRS